MNDARRGSGSRDDLATRGRRRPPAAHDGPRSKTRPALAVLRELGIADDDPHVNPNGGAIALGHHELTNMCLRMKGG